MSRQEKQRVIMFETFYTFSWENWRMLKLSNIDTRKKRWKSIKWGRANNFLFHIKKFSIYIYWEENFSVTLEREFFMKIFLHIFSSWAVKITKWFLSAPLSTACCYYIRNWYSWDLRTCFLSERIRVCEHFTRTREMEKKPSSATGNMSQKIIHPTMETHLITEKPRQWRIKS